MKKSLTLLCAALLACSLCGSDYAGLSAKGRSARKAGKYLEAAGHFKAAAGKAAKAYQKSESLLAVGLALQNARSYDEAVMYLEQAAGIKGAGRHTAALAWRHIAQCRMEQRKTSDAIAAYQNARNVKSSTWVHSVSTGELAKIFFALGKYEEAAGLYMENAAAKKVSKAGKFQALHQAAEAFFCAGNFNAGDKALKSAAEMVKVNKKLPDKEYVELIAAFRSDVQCKWDEAVKAYRDVMRMPKIKYILRRRAANRAAFIAFRKQQNRGLALEILKELRKTDKYGASDELWRDLHKKVKK